MINNMLSPATAPITVHSRHQTLLPLPAGILSFEETLLAKKIKIRRREVSVMQINIGKKCDLACHHCHVEAGPNRTENMVGETIDRLLELLAASPSIQTVDITGGAPELNPHFRRFVRAVRREKVTVYDRCNLTVFFQPQQEDTPEFLAENGIVIFASLPCYSRENVDKQRGDKVFDRSIRALQKLNALGYGKPDSGLVLNLVYNPVGAHLPPPQAQLEMDYRKQLGADFGVVFNQLLTITNMPIKRYLHYLRREKLLDDYTRLLVENFNPHAADNVMCNSMLSVGWDGQIYDCDFNQMLEIPMNWKPRTIWDIESVDDLSAGIAFDNHCYGCTAGAGSSCGGALTD